MYGDVTQITAKNESVEAANGVRYVYRRYGNTGTSALSLVFFQHYRGNIDNWDPILVDAIADQREVILLDNTGVGGSSGRSPAPSPRWRWTQSHSPMPWACARTTCTGFRWEASSPRKSR